MEDEQYVEPQLLLTTLEAEEWDGNEGHAIGGEPRNRT